jgi:coatomer protein complex subunit gamma
MDKKQEDIGGVAQIDKTTVFQDARVFNQSPVSPRKCRVILTKLALLLFTGESWGRQEATTLFFGISKLFQNKDASLRQMVYLVIKELAGSADDVIMVTSSIMKDTSVGSDVVYRANAIRALCRVIDASTVQAIERLVKTCIVDKNPSVASAALVSSYHLLPVAKDVVRRWQSEAAEAASGSKSGGFFGGFGGSSQTALQASTNYMTQYHAIGLLYQMRSGDRMSLVKMVQQYSAAGVVKSPAATVLLVRLAAKLAEEDPNLRKVRLQAAVVGKLLTVLQAHDVPSRRLVAPQVRDGQLRGCKGHRRHARRHRCRARPGCSRPPAVPHIPSCRHQVCRPQDTVADGFVQA